MAPHAHEPVGRVTRRPRQGDRRVSCRPPREATVIVAAREDGTLGGFLEAGTRPFASGCASSPVGYIEGWWVDPDLRRAGIGSKLVTAAEDWARTLGLTEMTSDALLANERSHAAHLALGYAEAERLVCFRKAL